jgi:hypothetical protein
VLHASCHIRVPPFFFIPFLQDIESLLKQWAGTFQIPDGDLMQRLTDATSGELQRPPDR